MHSSPRSPTAAAIALAGALALASLGAPEAASASVNVVDFHSEYDACIGKFRAAGLPGLVDQLDKSKHAFTIAPTNKKHYTKSDPDNSKDAGNGVGTGGTTLWWPSPTEMFQDGVPADGCATLYHEMKHLSDYDHGTNDSGDNCRYTNVNGKEVDSGISIAEVGAVRAENDYRRAQHLPLRTKFGTTDMPPPDAACKPPPPPPRGGGGCNVSGVGCPTGRSYGDPHIVTFNGYYYPMQAAGEFVLSRSIDGAFEVEMRSAPVPGRDDLTLNTAVAVKIGTHRLAFYGQAKPDGDPHSLRLDGLPIVPKPGQVEALPGGASISTSRNDSFLQMATGERVTLHAASMGAFNFINVSVTIPPERAGKYVGILGDGGGNPRLDLRTRDGKSMALANAYGDVARALGFSTALPNADAAFHIFVDRTFANSWRVRQEESLFDYAPGTSTLTFTDRSYPRKDFSAASNSMQGAIQSCRNAGVSGNLLAGCVVDVSATKSSVFANAIADAQSLVNVRLGTPVDQLRGLMPSIPGVPLPNLPSIRIPHF